MLKILFFFYFGPSVGSLRAGSSSRSRVTMLQNQPRVPRAPSQGPLTTGPNQTLLVPAST